MAVAFDYLAQRSFDLPCVVPGRITATIAADARSRRRPLLFRAAVWCAVSLSLRSGCHF